MPQLSRSQLAAYAAIGVLVLVLGGQWLARRSATAGASPGGSRHASSGGGSEAPPGQGGSAAAGGGADGSTGVALSGASRSAVVHVAGAVRHPGVYRLPGGARVQDAVRRAGGVTRRGDANAINLAAVLQDGVQIVVPQRISGAGAAAAIATSEPGMPGAPPAAPVNLNTATAEQLDTLDGVGPATAQKILDYRREHGGFRTVDDLGQVPGIGPKKLAALRGKVQV